MRKRITPISWVRPAATLRPAARAVGFSLPLMNPKKNHSISPLGLSHAAAVLFSLVAPSAHGGVLLPTYDAAGRFALGPLDRDYAGNLYVGPIGTNDFARTFLTFDLSSETAATGATTLTFAVTGVPLNEGNTSSTPQTFTLYSLASDWDGAAAPGPDPGTVLATVSFTPTTGDDTQALSFSSEALTTAFNNALGGNLHLGIKSDVEGPNVRSFKWMASREDPGLEPKLRFTTETTKLAMKGISVEASSNAQLLLGGTAEGSYRVYRSGDLEGPLYRKRWSERFAGTFPTGVSELPLKEPKGAEPRGFYIASDTEARARIMCVGDSITEGGTGYFIYRPTLDSLLTTAGYRYEFVGSKTNTQGGLTLKHEGYAGKTATEIAGLLSGTFPSNIADIVLIHAGHNYFADIQGEASIVNEVDAATRSMIATCRTHNPDVIILLAQVITSSKLPKYSYIPALNVRLAEVANDLNSPAQPVILVNQADGWDPVADTVADEVLPTEAGATKMANKWFAALQPLLE